MVKLARSLSQIVLLAYNLVLLDKTKHHILNKSVNFYFKTVLLVRISMYFLIKGVSSMAILMPVTFFPISTMLFVPLELIALIRIFLLNKHTGLLVYVSVPYLLLLT